MVVHTQRRWKFVNGLKEELVIKSGGVGKRLVCRKGVKACVILEREREREVLCFKFPDDSRKNATSMLWIASPVILASFVQGGGVAYRGAPICLVPRGSPTTTSQTSEGVAGIPG